MKNKNLLIITIIAIVNALGYGIIIPLIYSYSLRYGLNDFQNGLLFALYSICQFFATPIIGRMSDKFGRKPLLIISLLGSAASFFMMAFAPSALFLFLARALDGVTAGNIPVAYAVISDTTAQKDRAKGFGIMGAAFGFGIIFGPVISALTADLGIAIPFIIAGAVSLIAVLLVITILPETNQHQGELKKGKVFDFPKLFHSLRDANIGPLLLITLFTAIAFASFIYGFNPYSVKTFHLTPSQIAVLFMSIGIVGVIAQVALVGPITKRFGVRRPYILSLAVFTILFAGLFSLHNFWTFIILTAAVALPNSFIGPLTQALLSQETDAKSQGTIMGLYTAYISIGQIAGPLLGGLLATFGLKYPFLAASGAGLICLFLSFKAVKRDAHRESAF